MTPMEIISRFVPAVAKMRAAQREYFKHRDGAKLDECKALEREVDRMLVDVGDRQGKLFG